MISFNFLPTQQRQKLKTEIFTRLFWAFSIAVIFWAVVFGIVIFTAIQYLSIQGLAVEERVERISSQEKTIEAEKTEQEINEFNGLLSRITNIQKNNPHNAIDILEKIAEVVPAGAELTDLSFNAQTGRLFINGHANLRTQVLAMQNSLENDETFSSVESPLSNLLKAEDINFQFTLTIAENK
ncbi:MAG: hypothetical protein R3251_01415 [Candidatus Spechtbacterales bacterium]|nr:hypothetical protein [Candidatus Spechtbacterales bacterium]